MQRLLFFARESLRHDVALDQVFEGISQRIRCPYHLPFITASSLGYPCHVEKFERAGFAPDKTCDEPRRLVFRHVPKTAGESIEAALKITKGKNGRKGLGLPGQVFSCSHSVGTMRKLVLIL